MAENRTTIPEDVVSNIREASMDDDPADWTRWVDAHGSDWVETTYTHDGGKVMTRLRDGAAMLRRDVLAEFGPRVTEAADEEYIDACLDRGIPVYRSRTEK